MTSADTPPRESGAGDPPSILSKAFDLLRAFNPYARVMTLSELARASGLPKSTVHRLLARLVELGVVEHHRGGYKIGLDMLQLCASTPAGYMRDLAMPYLTKLHRWCGHTVHMAVLRHYDVVYLEKLSVSESPTSITSVGARLPAHCTALGKALLAHENLDDLRDFLPRPLPALTPRSITGVEVLIDELRQVRADGVARECEEAQLGLACLAAPICMNGFAVGAISVGFPMEFAPPPNLAGALRATAAQIGSDVDAGLGGGRERWFPREI
ncbi:Transcriptional regulator KdgR [Nocardia cerradoensis]|uniref:Transcriptional regulator KdgR n=1 Tax=Nocardia cerradoensis TaxID=85688 RepID=A0A231GXL3_9NOCA|nr:IclR family transcriptional regulator [Nocardia cerradoensis]OXR41251.1 Transcriptional regulator KdgR [Nocardia cerradoensis]